MRAYQLGIIILLLCSTAKAFSSYECIAIKIAKGHNIQEFPLLILSPIAGKEKKISILRTMRMGKDEIYMDEQFLGVKRSSCSLIGKGNKKFYSAGLQNDIYGYRLDRALFSSEPPEVFELGYVSDKGGKGNQCVPALYQCSKTPKRKPRID